MEKEKVLELLREAIKDHSGDSATVLPFSVHLHFHGPVILGDQFATQLVLKYGRQAKQ